MYQVFNIIKHSTTDKIKRDIMLSRRVICPPTLISDAPYFICEIRGNNKYRMTSVAMVYDFTAPKAVIYMGEEFMDSLCISDGDIVRLKMLKKTPDKGTLIRIRPHEEEFTKLEDPKGFLERGITKFYPIVNRGDTIRIGLYHFDIIDTVPSRVILTIDTDLSVDFLEPKETIIRAIK